MSFENNISLFPGLRLVSRDCPDSPKVGGLLMGAMVSLGVARAAWPRVAEPLHGSGSRGNLAPDCFKRAGRRAPGKQRKEKNSARAGAGQPNQVPPPLATPRMQHKKTSRQQGARQRATATCQLTNVLQKCTRKCGCDHAHKSNRSRHSHMLGKLCPHTTCFAADVPTTSVLPRQHSTSDEMPSQELSAATHLAQPQIKQSGARTNFEAACVFFLRLGLDFVWATWQIAWEHLHLGQGRSACAAHVLSPNQKN